MLSLVLQKFFGPRLEHVLSFRPNISALARIVSGCPSILYTGTACINYCFCSVSVKLLIRVSF